MGRQRVLLKNSVIHKLIPTLFLIILPIYIIGIMIYNWGMGAVKADITNTIISQLSSLNLQLDGDIRRVRTLMNDCLTSADTHMLSDAYYIMDDYEKTKAITGLMDRLSSIQKSCGFASNVSLHIASINKSVSAFGGVNNFEPDAVSHLFTYGKKRQFVEWQGKLYLVSINFIETFNKNTRPSLLLDVEVSRRELAEMLDNLNTYEGGGSFYIYSDSNIISAEENSAIASEIISKFNVNSDISMLGHATGSFEMEAEKTKMMVMYARMDGFNGTAVKYIPESSVMGAAKKYTFWYRILTVICILMAVLYSFYTYLKVMIPLKRLVTSFENVKNGNLTTRIDYQSKDEFGYLYNAFNSMVIRLDELINQVYGAKLLAQKSELKKLQAQINPHFLYNSFFALQRSILSEDIQKAALFAEKLGKCFKYITRNELDEALLEKETDYARVYSDIQAMRFSRRLNIVFSPLPEEYSNILVPRLILQPLIENALDHGLQSVEKGGLIKVSFGHSVYNVEGSFISGGDDKTDDDVLTISVEDNGACFNEELAAELSMRLEKTGDEDEVTAITNIHQRLKLRFGYPSGLYISVSELGGMKAEIKIFRRKAGRENDQIINS